MSGFTRTCETDIAVPADEVFAYVSDIAKHPDWADQEMTVEHVSGPPAGLGATYKTNVVIDMPVGHGKAEATVTIVEAEAPRHLAYESTDSSGHYRWTIDLTDQGDRTHVVQSVVRLDGPAWIKVTQPLIWKAMGGKMVVNGLANLKGRLES